MKFMKKHSTAIWISIAIALAVILVVGMILLHGGKKEPQFGTYTEPENTTTGIETTGPAVDPTTEPQITQPEDTVPLTTETLPNDTVPTTTETTPGETTPVATTPKATEPVKTTPDTSKPADTQHKHNYTSKVTKEATCTSDGTKTFTCSCGDTYTETIKGSHDYATKVVPPTTSEQGYTMYTCKVCGHGYTGNYTDKLPAETESSDEFGGVTPDNISVANTAGWSTDDFEWWYEQHRDSMTTAQKKAYLRAYYRGYTCGFEGHDCKCEYDHNEFLQPCLYCGLTLECKGRICTDQYGFTICNDNKCYSYDEKLDPSKYCQTCGKPKYGDPTQICRQKVMDGNCSSCGVYLKAHTCHTCKQEDIDAYNKGN